jgi:hypothetical protein
MRKGCTTSELREMVKKERIKFSSERQMAIAMGVSPQYLNHVISGFKNPGSELAKYFGMEPGFVQRTA